MSEIPYLGLEPFAEENAPFFFGRDEQKRAIARSLRISRLTVLFGESGVGKSSILRAGVASQFRRDAEQNRQDSGKPQLAVVVFRDWHGMNPLKELLETIRDSVAKARGIKPTDLEDQPTPVENLQVWTESLGGEQGGGKLLIILDQFEEYFQYHTQESGKGTFADEFPRWVNRSDLRINFLIAMRQDGLAKLHRFQNQILNIFDNQIELKCLDRSAAGDAIVKPIGEYNLRQIVTDHFQTSRLTVLSAASGMGKSRVLRAIADNLKGSITFRNWRSNPVTDLIQQINADLKARFPDISVPEPGTSLTETLQWWTQRIREKGKDNQLFIILDQFEEFFQYQPPEMGEGSFVAEFARAVNHPELPVHFIIAIRDEARDILKHFQERIPIIFDHLLQIKQLEEKPEIPDLVKPIEEPAQYPSKAINIEPELVEAVLNQLSDLSQRDLVGTAGSEISGPRTSQESVKIEAPLLQLVMERLWKEELDKKHSHCLRLKTLNDLSIPEKNITGAQRIANDHLSEQMQALSSDRERNAMAIVFKYLVSAEGTKIAYPVLDLPEPTGLDQTKLLSVLDQLDRKRILRTVKVPSRSNESYYEIFHDILASPILKWREQYLLAKKLKQQEEKIKQKAKEEEEKRKKKTRQWIQMGTALSIMAVGMYFFMYEPYRKDQIKFQEMANSNREEAMKIFYSQPRPSGQIAGLVLAMQLGKQFSDPSELIKNLNKMLTDIHEKNILQVGRVALLSISFSPDGKLFATSAQDGYVYLWTPQGKQQAKFQVSKAPVMSLNFSPDGKLLATVSNDNIVRLWNLQGEQQAKFQVSKAPVMSLNFGPDGKPLATVSNDNIVRLWNLQGKPEEEFLVSSDPIMSVSFSPDGELLSTGFADGTVRLWDILQGKQQAEFLVSKAQVMRVNFSPNGKLLATVSNDNNDNIVRLWTLQGKKQADFPVPGTLVRSLSFSPDEKLLATVSDDGLVRLWDIEEKSQIDNNNLKELLNSGCNWLGDYLETNSQAQDTLSLICKNK